MGEAGREEKVDITTVGWGGVGRECCVGRELWKRRRAFGTAAVVEIVRLTTAPGGPFA